MAMLSIQDDTETPFGERLAKARSWARLNRAQMAKAVGISPGALDNYEKGTRMPGTDVTVKWAKVTRVPLEYLLSAPDLAGHPSDWDGDTLAPVFVLHGQCKGQTVLPFVAAAPRVVEVPRDDRLPFLKAS